MGDCVWFGTVFEIFCSTASFNPVITFQLFYWEIKAPLLRFSRTLLDVKPALSPMLLTKIIHVQ